MRALQRALCAVDPMTAPRLEAHGYWVAVRCTFQCRSCGFAAPLDQLDIDGSVECAYCGLCQRFEPSTWIERSSSRTRWEICRGPSPKGARPIPAWIAPDNPFRDVGETVTFSELRQSGSQMVDGMMVPRSLQIRVAPGFPVCRRCRVPVRIALGPEGTTTWCGACSESATYALPERARALGPGLIAVVAEEHRLSRARATESRGDGTNVTAVSCPSCGAPLDLRGGDRTLKCQFCSTFCRVPGRFFLRQGQGTIEPETWWLLFDRPLEKATRARRGRRSRQGERARASTFRGWAQLQAVDHQRRVRLGRALDWLRSGFARRIARVHGARSDDRVASAGSGPRAHPESSGDRRAHTK